MNARQGSKSAILFRVDSRKEIAIGHLKRCVSLALKFQEKDIPLSFVTVHDSFTSSFLSEKGFDYDEIKGEVNSKEDGESTEKYAKKRGAEIIVVDSYDLDYQYRKNLMDKGFFLVSIDDLADMDIASSIVINGNLNAEKYEYPRVKIPLVFSGIKYLILDKKFWNLNNENFVGKEKVDNILITMGGIDHYNLTSIILNILEQVDYDFEITAIVGPYYENKELIRAQINLMKKRVYWIESPPSLFQYMIKCSMAFSAGGQTIYELAALGCPTIGFKLWKNQEGNVAELSKLNAIRGIDYSDDDIFIDKLTKFTKELLFQKAERVKMSGTALKLIDGNGAERVYKAILDSQREWKKTNSGKK